MILVFLSWYFLTIITYGTNIPSGLFLPGMIFGCALGSIYADSFLAFNNRYEWVDISKDFLFA